MDRHGVMAVGLGVGLASDWGGGGMGSLGGSRWLAVNCALAVWAGGFMSTYDFIKNGNFNLIWTLMTKKLNWNKSLQFKHFITTRY